MPTAFFLDHGGTLVSFGRGQADSPTAAQADFAGAELPAAGLLGETARLTPCNVFPHAGTKVEPGNESQIASKARRR